MLRRYGTTHLGLIRPAGGAASEQTAMDGDTRQPRDGDNSGHSPNSVHFLQRQVAYAVRGERVHVEFVLLV